MQMQWEQPTNGYDQNEEQDANERAPRKRRPESVEAGKEPIEWGPRSIAKRVRQVIAQHDAGDVVAAAHRLGVPVHSLIQLERVLTEPSRDGLFSPAARDILTAVVLRYRADATWLLTGSEHPPIEDLPGGVRVWLANFFLAVGNRIIAEFQIARRLWDA
jgi:hypothetical protein